jgi:hypothetical protein
MVAPGKVKSTYDLAVKAKQRLTHLKADVSAELGQSVSESAILELLIADADVKTLARRFNARR